MYIVSLLRCLFQSYILCMYGAKSQFMNYAIDLYILKLTVKENKGKGLFISWSKPKKKWLGYESIFKWTFLIYEA